MKLDLLRSLLKYGDSSINKLSFYSYSNYMTTSKLLKDLIENKLVEYNEGNKEYVRAIERLQSMTENYYVSVFVIDNIQKNR